MSSTASLQYCIDYLVTNSNHYKLLGLGKVRYLLRTRKHHDKGSSLLAVFCVWHGIEKCEIRGHRPNLLTLVNADTMSQGK